MCFNFYQVVKMRDWSLLDSACASCACSKRAACWQCSVLGRRGSAHSARYQIPTPRPPTYIPQLLSGGRAGRLGTPNERRTRDSERRESCERLNRGRNLHAQTEHALSPQEQHAWKSRKVHANGGQLEGACPAPLPSHYPLHITAPLPRHHPTDPALVQWRRGAPAAPLPLYLNTQNPSKTRETQKRTDRREPRVHADVDFRGRWPHLCSSVRVRVRQPHVPGVLVVQLSSRLIRARVWERRAADFGKGVEALHVCQKRHRHHEEHPFRRPDTPRRAMSFRLSTVRCQGRESHGTQTPICM